MTLICCWPVGLRECMVGSRISWQFQQEVFSSFFGISHFEKRRPQSFFLFAHCFHVQKRKLVASFMLMSVLTVCLSICDAGQLTTRWNKPRDYLSSTAPFKSLHALVASVESRIHAAEKGVLYRPSEAVKKEHPATWTVSLSAHSDSVILSAISSQDSIGIGTKEIPVVTTYEELKGYITEAVERMEPNSKKQKTSWARWPKFWWSNKSPYKSVLIGESFNIFKSWASDYDLRGKECWSTIFEMLKNV